MKGEYMNNISFGSTYRIPITQAGVNNAKKERLRTLIESYPNGLIGKSKTGQARVSVPDSEDSKFEQKLKTIGYKVFQKFEGDNIPKEQIDSFIKSKLDERDYSQVGKKMKRMSREMKEQRRFERRFTEPVKRQNVDISDDITDISNDTSSKNKQLSNFELRKRAENEIAQIRAINEIKKSPAYLRIKEQYGEEFADAVFWGKIY